MWTSRARALGALGTPRSGSGSRRIQTHTPQATRHAAASAYAVLAGASTLASSARPFHCGLVSHATSSCSHTRSGPIPTAAAAAAASPLAALPQRCAACCTRTGWSQSFTTHAILKDAPQTNTAAPAASRSSSSGSSSDPPRGPDAQKPPDASAAHADSSVTSGDSCPVDERTRWRYKYWQHEIDLHKLTSTHPPADPPTAPPKPKRSMIAKGQRAMRNAANSMAARWSELREDPRIITEWGASGWASLKSGARHYWSGTKLLWADIRTAVSLLRKLARGQISGNGEDSLTWRERRQLRRTAADLARVGPFLVILLVPFMELALPVLLRVFPGFLPSTFQSKAKRDAILEQQMKVRLEIAEMLQEALAGIAKKQVEARKQKRDTERAESHDAADEVAAAASADPACDASNLLSLLSDVRDGRRISAADMAKLGALFETSITLERMSRKQLVRLSRFFNLLPYGSDKILRMQLGRKIRHLRQDDRLLAQQLDALSTSELRAACHERGIRSVGLTDVGYRRQLRSWLDLSLKYRVPDSLLLLSRPIGLLEQRPSRADIREALLTFDEEVLNEIVPAELEEPEAETRLKMLKLENARILEEEEQRKVEQKRAEAAKERAEKRGESAPSSVTESASPSETQPADPVDLHTLSGQLLELVFQDMARSQALRTKAERLKRKQAEARARKEAEAREEAEEGERRPAAASEKPASPTVSAAPSEDAIVAPDDDDATAESLSSKLLTTFLDSKVERILQGIDAQIAQADKERAAEEEAEAKAEAEAKNKDGTSTATKSTSAPSVSDDEEVLLQRWISQTLAERGTKVSPADSAYILQTLRAMAEDEGVALSQRTMRAITKMAKRELEEADSQREIEESDKPVDRDTQTQAQSSDSARSDREREKSKDA